MTNNIGFDIYSSPCRLPVAFMRFILFSE